MKRNYFILVIIMAISVLFSGCGNPQKGALKKEISSAPSKPQTKEVQTVNLDKTSITLDIGKTEQLTVTVSPDNATDPTLTWSSSDTSIATVDSSGLVTAVKNGACSISVASNSGVTASCNVTVNAPASAPVTSLADSSAKSKSNDTKKKESDNQQTANNQTQTTTTQRTIPPTERKIVAFKHSDAPGYKGLLQYDDEIIDKNLIKSEYFDVSMEQKIFQLINQERTSHGLKALIWDESLHQTAEAKSKDMMERNYFAHESPDGKYFNDTLNSIGYKCITGGENLGKNKASNWIIQTADAFVSGWFGSPGHYQNLMTANYTNTGIGVCIRYNSDGTFDAYATQQFTQVQ